eukprot:PITA_11043
MDLVEDISQIKEHHTKSSGWDITGPQSSKMQTNMSGPVVVAKEWASLTTGMKCHSIPRLQQLQELDEKRLDAIHQTTMIQQQRTKWHDKTIKQKQFQKGNWALLYDSRFENFQGKLRTRWLGPYEIDAVFPNGTVRILTIGDNRTPLLVNGYPLHPY